MTPKSSAEAFAPASMGNVGIGFDILGLAFMEPGDRVIATVTDAPGLSIIAIEGDGGQLPLNPLKNTASVAAAALLDQLGINLGVGLIIKKGLPLASGLGSSAASAVAAVVAVNALLDNPLPREELLRACLEGEALVSGYHADNVGPSLLGGITLITDTEVSHIRRLPVPDDLHLALVTPAVEVPTVEARAVLPAEIPLRMMVQQTGGVARMVDALYRGDIEAMAAAMASDCVVEPARAHLMPHFARVRGAALQAGALSLVISGAGPTLCAVCDSVSAAEMAAAAMSEVYDEAGIAAVARATQVDQQGARVIQTTP